MSHLNPEKLSVEFRGGITPTSPFFPRHYTLTHSDSTAELFVTIARSFAWDKINPLRDEVMGKWIKCNNSFAFHAFVQVDGPDAQISATVRDEIFRRELPLALKAIRYADHTFFAIHPSLDNFPIIIDFVSSDPRFRRRENWGTFKDYTS
ncbi:staygreen family protein [Sediminibacillus albus]|uniref:Staygreen protein n=1 Tax=Sediminibacillus albus TaxID=407036 RepID=A0A1G9A0L4_9BACI|nr:staygreen family protein [Sediminibacillus albus]SDK20912.1 Staygreen protein [Sediminibacillus albus]